MSSLDTTSRPKPGGGGIRSPQDLGAGLFLVLVAAIALWQGVELDTGTLNQIGPGMLPRALAVLTGLCGAAILGSAFLYDGAGLARWSLRGPVFILGAAVAFGLTVRSLGLAVAGPIVVLIGAFASSKTRWSESILFAAIMTVFCLLLFKVALGLPIPVAPWLIGY